jgi:hypothetical protein
MNALKGEKILMAWERSRYRSDQEAALILLALALPESSIEALAALPLAERDTLLLELRARTLGSRMESRARCLECGVQLEFELDAHALARSLREQILESVEDSSGLPMRPINTQDLLACSVATSDEHASRILLERALRVKSSDAVGGVGEASTLEAELGAGPGTLSASEFAAVMERFERLNAAAELQVRLHCGACGARPQLDLNIAHYVVREIAGAARRLMVEIHELARAYGWSERSIARMTDQRRAAYLEILQA